MELKKRGSDNNREIVLAISTVVLLFLNITPLNILVRDLFSFVFSPIQYSASTLSNGVAVSLETISEISDLKDDNLDLKLRLAQLESQNKQLQLLLDQNNSLKKELDLGEAPTKLIEAKVMGSGVLGVDDAITINKGRADGVKKGDVVKIGNTYIGVISNAEQKTSRVTLPNSESSFIEVFIADAADAEMSLEELQKKYKEQTNASKLFSGIAVGSSSGVLIENISNQAEISEGDSIIINDQKYNEFYYLGSISEIVDDPSASQEKAFIKTPFNFQKLNFVFVEIGDE